MLSTFAIAFSMSTDAFAAALSKGAVLETKPKLAEAFRTGLIFGSVEAGTPLIGWACGLAASSYVAAIDHWVAFGLLGAIGLKMMWDGLTRQPEATRASRHSAGVLVLTAIGTSLDALAVGVTLALLSADIVVTAVAIGGTTCLMAALGVTLGRIVGARLGRAAEFFGGLVLLVIGTTILVRHLGIWG